MGSAALQGELWGIAAQDWAELQEPKHLPVWNAMLDAANIKQGARFLDAGCGSGGASLLAAQRGAHVSGLDASPALIGIAQERVPQGDFRVGDLEDLPFGDNVFDAIIAAMSVQYTSNPIAALVEFKRVCDRSGILVICTWGEPKHCDQRVISKAVRDSLPTAPAGGGPFALSPPGALENLVEQAGWKPIGSSVVDCPFEYPNLDAHWQAQSSGGPFQAALRTVGVEKLRKAVEEAVRPFQTDTGVVLLNNRFRYVTAVI